ncbi:hypothetical protein, partial [Sinorhizobium meliloti]|uniref:hypothetical protein n=1 Tax=Rhizobium meliloti TaxID=382 RepID=UPI001AECC620
HLQSFELPPSGKLRPGIADMGFRPAAMCPFRHIRNLPLRVFLVSQGTSASRPAGQSRCKSDF